MDYEDLDGNPRTVVSTSALTKSINSHGDNGAVPLVEPNTTIQLRDALSKANLTTLHHKQQLGVREIAARLDVSANTVYRALDAHSIELIRHPYETHKEHLQLVLTQDALAEAVEDEQLTVAQLAARYDCSVQTIYTYLDRHDIELPDRPNRTHQPETLTVESVRRLYYDQGLSIRATAEGVGVSNLSLIHI